AQGARALAEPERGSRLVAMPPGSGVTGVALDSVVHIIQVSLAPVFLLSGIATLLNVFSTRLARVADLVDTAAKALDGMDAAAAATQSLWLASLQHRALALDFAVALAAAG